MRVEIENDIAKCQHDWVSNSGFYTRVAVTYEEPDFYPPMGLLQLEVCPKCGAVRLPHGAESWQGIRMPKEAVRITGDINDYTNTVPSSANLDLKRRLNGS